MFNLYSLFFVGGGGLPFFLKSGKYSQACSFRYVTLNIISSISLESAEKAIFFMHLLLSKFIFLEFWLLLDRVLTSTEDTSIIRCPVKAIGIPSYGSKAAQLNDIDMEETEVILIFVFESVKSAIKQKYSFSTDSFAFLTWKNSCRMTGWLLIWIMILLTPPKGIGEKIISMISIAKRRAFPKHWWKFIFLGKLAEYQDDTQVYTDGTKTETKFRYAAVIPSKSLSLPYQLPPPPTPLQPDKCLCRAYGN